MDFYSISDEVLRLSLLTHVYRAAPKDPNSSATFKLDCIEAARATLDRHHDCMAVIHQDNDAYFAIYINWWVMSNASAGADLILLGSGHSSSHPLSLSLFYFAT